MRLLILGGTEFVGRALAEDALARGWEVTVFHRGRHPAPPGASVLRGDRTAEGGLAALADGEWDIVADTWSGAPSAVRDAARLLAGRAGRYAYVSSRSVHREPVAAGAAEDAPVVDGSPDAGDVPYAQAKRGGELAALDAFGDRALLLRAGLIIGPRENIGRLPWWLLRIARGGPVPVPGPRDAGLQYIDVRDLASWSLDAAARGLGGPYGLISRPGHATMAGLLEACVRATGSDAELRWLPPEVFLSAGVEPWQGMPLWLPEGPVREGIYEGNTEKAHAAGLRCRPVEETVADTWAWLRSAGGRAPLREDRPAVGIDAETEARLLAAAG
ncbi:NAD-dependent epimerase/dehydratase family protein [Streptomyces sp. AV19]|uniref:NAD-dependent epimerase/dehydratase family protein n=1 Tax=Streptomyces sp. AV19 TaxID=2793068 RepID=UPI0018FEB3C6|nr:NAD-dependent epimerase/dehydratase family protein [Streptomyces sp. AV19]MBH1934519.1 NAD-dependent epimerase/dehydratase family protein [Streptomyces sp. AV19]MDG4533313.1 NAD-dependent epimerase/dehydratase family protein [Streptomyces sp. AV19]